MENIKDKFLNAVQDGLLDSNEVIEKLLDYIDEDTLYNLIEDSDWSDLIGLSTDEDNEDEF